MRRWAAGRVVVLPASLVADACLPSRLQALAEVADYRPPTAASTGEYSLRSECWREFDPFYLHYTP